MKKLLITVLILGGTFLSADIYDDYELLADGIGSNHLTNMTQKNQLLDLEKKIKELTQKIDEINESKSIVNIHKKSTATNHSLKSYLSDKTRKKLKKLIKEKVYEKN